MKFVFRLCLYLLLTVSAVAQSPESVLQAVSGTPADVDLMNVIAGSARVELFRAGLDDQSPPLLGRGLDTAAIRAEAVVRGVDYVVTILFTGDGTGASAEGDITFDVSLYRVSDGTLLGSTTIDTFVDLTLDSRVARAVRGLVFDAGINGERIVREDPPPVEEGPEVAGPSDSPGVTAAPVVMPQVSAPRPREEPGKGIGVAAHGAPFLLVGDASDTFQYGANGFLTATYRPGFSRLGFEAGLRTGAIRLFPNENISPGEAYLVIAGPEIGLGTVYRKPARVALRFSGGVSVITVRPEGGELLAKAVPYAAGGIEALVSVWKSISVGIHADYVIIFEEQLPVMGLSPAVVVRLGP